MAVYFPFVSFSIFFYQWHSVSFVWWPNDWLQIDGLSNSTCRWKGSCRVAPTFWHHICACISELVCLRAWVCVCLCINTRDELTADSSITVSLYNRGYSSHRNNPFNLLHLSRHLSLMSDCTKKGWGGLGLGGWNKQLGCAVSLPLTLPPSQWLQGLLWRGVTVSLLTIKANPNF